MGERCDDSAIELAARDERRHVGARCFRAHSIEQAAPSVPLSILLAPPERSPAAELPAHRRPLRHKAPPLAAI
jgi:hypothetical protein